jgi:methylated-DNA-[protein]-cysteine S-methyltransferase
MKLNIQKYFKIIDSPMGKIRLIATKAKLIGLDWDVRLSQQKGLIEDKSHPILKQTEKELKEYFKGKRVSFTVPIEMKGTAFQKKAWQALSMIPYGQTLTYSEQALLLHKPSAVRAVGGANSKNPIAIIVPCHRVIGKNRDLTGFAGGLQKKKYLLELETT